MRTFTTLILGIVSTPVFAVELQNISNRVDSGSYIIDRPSADRPKLPEFMTKNLSSIPLPPPEKILPATRQGGVKIQLNGINFTGNTVISSEQLQTIAQPYVGKTLSINELEELRLKISQYYAQQGYVNSGAILPDQQFKNGIITLQIIEGKLSDIRITGSERLQTSYISDRLYDSEQVLDINELRENFQQLLLDPLVEQMNARLVPSNQRGNSILEVNVTRARPYQLTATADNYNPPSIGSEVGHLSGWVRNLTGLGDIVSGSIAYSEGLIGGSGSFSIPLNAQNTRFNFHIDRNNARIVEKTLEPLDIQSRYVNYEFGISQPVIQNLNRSFTIGTMFNYKKNRTFLGELNEPFDFSGGAVNGITKDSVLRFTLDFTERLPRQVFSARSTTSVGINAFSPTRHNNPAIPDGDFVAWLGQAQYAAQLFDTGANIVLRGDAQYSDDPLMTLERFALGGRYSVRGYRENELVRDKGYDVSAELRYPLFKNAGTARFPGELTIFPFMDYGAGQNRGDRTNRNSLYSTGIGLNWQPFERVNTEIIYAHPLKTPSAKPDHNLQDISIQWHVNVSAF